MNKDKQKISLHVPLFVPPPPPPPKKKKRIDNDLRKNIKYHKNRRKPKVLALRDFP